MCTATPAVSTGASRAARAHSPTALESLARMHGKHAPRPVSLARSRHLSDAATSRTNGLSRRSSACRQPLELQPACANDTSPSRT
eukprot:1384892-Prymnesium_polylepis.2